MSETASYGTTFFNSIGSGSTRSAARVLPLVQAALNPHSVIDVGCGRGQWAAECLRLGVADAVGVDGDYVDRDGLAISENSFFARDLTHVFDLGRRFDLAICLEVGEHIPPAASGALVDNLMRHASMVLFSAAVPGQGGQDHINEAPLGFWRDLFEQRGYRCFDPFRPALRGDADVEPWYRNNMLLYVRTDAVDGLPDAVRQTLIHSDRNIPDYSSPLFRLRKLVLRGLPRPAVTAMARTKHAVRNALKLAS